MNKTNSAKAPRTLSHREVREFYDNFGAKQDKQGFYEDVAVTELCKFAKFGSADAVIEFGCGTGKLARYLFESQFGAHTSYLGIDLSSTMIQLATNRLTQFTHRTRLTHSDGDLHLDIESSKLDRFISCYVLDLLSADEIQLLLQEAHRVLTPGGLLCVISLTFGNSWATRTVSNIWTWLHTIRPTAVGGCRPVSLDQLLPTRVWTIQHRSIVSAFTVASEVVVASKVG